MLFFLSTLKSGIVRDSKIKVELMWYYFFLDCITVRPFSYCSELRIKCSYNLYLYRHFFLSYEIVRMNFYFSHTKSFVWIFLFSHTKSFVWKLTSMKQSYEICFRWNKFVYKKMFSRKIKPFFWFVRQEGPEAGMIRIFNEF